MKLTEKDMAFLAKLRQLMQQKELWVETRKSEPDYMVLRGNYGEKISRNFHMTRQGVRWRFQRLMNQVYVEAFETILAIESTFGCELRQDAIRISKQRHQLHEQLTREAFQNAPGNAPKHHNDPINQD